jgi:hypothetical protein
MKGATTWKRKREVRLLAMLDRSDRSEILPFIVIVPPMEMTVIFTSIQVPIYPFCLISN